MKVKSVAHIFEQDVKALPGDVLELRQPLAEEFLKRGIVIPVREASPVELAATDGAPETAVARRGRRGRPAAQET